MFSIGLRGPKYPLLSKALFLRSFRSKSTRLTKRRISKCTSNAVTLKDSYIAAFQLEMSLIHPLIRKIVLRSQNQQF